MLRPAEDSPNTRPWCSRFPRRIARWLLVCAASAAVLVVAVGCQRQAPRGSGRRTAAPGGGRQAQTEILLAGVAEILNELPQRVDLNLTPAQPLLTASTSADGREVLATVTTNPAMPEAGVNYVRLASGNASFRYLNLGTRDVLRIYYISSDQEELDRGIEERSSIELPIRRVDAQDPDNALILEVSLNFELLTPERIEIWRYSDKRMEQIANDLKRYEAIRQPAVGWEPSPDRGALANLVERSNQWLRGLPEESSVWQPTPLLEGVPAELREAKGVAAAVAADNLAEGQFTDAQGRLLQESVWMRDIADWARGAALTDVDTAAALFDWTVRNVQLDDPARARTVHFPWQVVAYGHGNATHRAWVFVELCRQLGIPAAVLRFAPDADAEAVRELPAVMVDGELFLFDAEYGLPLLADGKVATLADVISNPQLMRQFDLPETPYPLTAAELQHVTAQIVAAPLQLTRRAAELEAALEGAQIVTLSSDVDELQSELNKVDGVAAVALWPAAFHGLADSHTTTQKTRQAEVAQFAPFAQIPELWKARVLHFQGYKEVPREERNNPLAQPKDGHREAVGLYQDPRVRPADSELATFESTKQIITRSCKLNASYWMGLLSYDRENLPAARFWLGEQSLEAAPNGPWAPGARYNLARTLHALAEKDGDESLAAEAVELLRGTPRDAPQWAGNQVLARRWQPDQEPAADAEAATDPAPDATEPAEVETESEPESEPADAAEEPSETAAADGQEP